MTCQGMAIYNYYYYYYYYFPQLSFHPVAVVITVAQIKQIITIHKGDNTKTQYNNTKHNKYKYTCYQNTHTIV